LTKSLKKWFYLLLYLSNNVIKSLSSR
jgi:hypothetical protein